MRVHSNASFESPESPESPGTLHVMRATEAQLPAVAEMRAEAAYEEAVFDRLRATKQKRFASKELDRLQRLAQCSEVTTSWTLVAVEEGHVVGSVDVSVAKEDVLRDAGLAVDENVDSAHHYVDNVVVKEACRGRGVGTRLMEAVEVEVGGGAGVLFVRVEMNNTEAVRLYAKLGYENICGSDDDECASTVGVVVALCKRMT